jgi:hypothetical protein
VHRNAHTRAPTAWDRTTNRHHILKTPKSYRDRRTHATNIAELSDKQEHPLPQLHNIRRTLLKNISLTPPTPIIVHQTTACIYPHPTLISTRLPAKTDTTTASVPRTHRKSHITGPQAQPSASPRPAAPPNPTYGQQYVSPQLHARSLAGTSCDRTGSRTRCTAGALCSENWATSRHRIPAPFAVSRPRKEMRRVNDPGRIKWLLSGISGLWLGHETGVRCVECSVMRRLSFPQHAVFPMSDHRHSIALFN